MNMLALVLAATAGPVEMHREQSLDFEVDERLQQDGGVQYFYELAAPTAQPARASALKRFRALDELSTPGDEYQAMMSRIVYTVDRDITFFTEARARDVEYLRAVAPDMGLSAAPDGSFVVSRVPANRFRLTWFEAPIASASDNAALDHFFEFLPRGEQPASVVLQRNFGFTRVMGWRTAERAVTFTAHVSLGPGRTRVIVCSMSLLHHLPPFFLGGKQRVFQESVDGAAELIGHLRSYAGK